MDRGFWDKLKKPIFVLAPMANVTDAAFRRIIAKYSRPQGPAVFWTEFVSVEGLLSRGREKLLPDLWYTESERPIVAQIFGGKPEQFFEVAQLLVKLGFDGIDINMGCPHDGVEKSGACAILIKDPARAKQIILETKRGVAAAGSSIPVSVKTRMGYNNNEMDTWIPALLETKPAVLTLHLRTRKEMSAVPAHWDQAARAVELRNLHSPETLLFGNGDVQDLAQARQKVAETGVDGVMLGRAIFGNPWLFSEKIPTVQEKLNVCLEHTKLFEELFGPGKGIGSDRLKPFDVMKKHYKAYVNGFDGAKELRMKMMKAENIEQLEQLVIAFLNSYTTN